MAGQARDGASWIQMRHDQHIDGGSDAPGATEVLAGERSRRDEERCLVVATVLVGVFGAVALGARTLVSAPAVAALVVSLSVVVAVVVASRLSPPVVAGLVWWAGSALVAALSLHLADTDQHTVSLSLSLAASGAVVVAATTVGPYIRRGQSPGHVLSRAQRVFTVPTTGLAAVLLGGGVALPLVGTYSPVVSHPDSAWFVASTRYVQEHGIELLQRTQDVWLPHLTIGPLVALAGYEAAVAFAVLTLVAVVVLTGYLAYRLTGRGAPVIAAAATVMSCPGLVDRANVLPMYPAAFFLAFGAGWILHRAMATAGAPRWWSVIAGLGFLLGYEAHGVGQVFLVVPFVLLVLHPWQQARRPLLITLATLVVASVPRMVLNLSEGGLTAFRSNYADFFIQKYINVVNQEFWGHNNDTNPIGYLGNLPGMFEEVWGSGAILLLLAIPVIYLGYRSGHRQVVFVVAALLSFIVPLAVLSPAPYGRYVLPLTAGVAVVVGLGIGKTLIGSSDGIILGRLLLVAICATAFVQTTHVLSVKAEDRVSVEQGAPAKLARKIDDDRAVIGSRSHHLARLDSSVVAYNWRILNEEDWVTYLSWPTDASVMDMMERNDIGWVYVMPQTHLEVQYHQTWLEPFYGEDVVHPTEVDESEEFCLAGESSGYLLYRRGDCEPGDVQRNPNQIVDGLQSAALEGADDVES